MKPLHIIGQPGSGKTTLIAELIREMVRREIRVGSMKHSAHLHELDKPGKDSFIHRKAGASIASMINQEMAAIYLPRTAASNPENILKTYYSQLDLVLIEGWISGPHDKIEVWREATNKAPVFPDAGKVRAFVSNDPLPKNMEQSAVNSKITNIRRDEIGRLADFILGQDVLQKG